MGAFQYETSKKDKHAKYLQIINNLKIIEVSNLKHL